MLEPELGGGRGVFRERRLSVCLSVSPAASLQLEPWVCLGEVVFGKQARAEGRGVLCLAS